MNRLRQNRVYAFNTHYKIYDYNLGDFPTLERTMTFHDYISFTHTPRYHYDDINNILYVPRGLDEFMIEQWNGKPITYIENTTTDTHIVFKMNKPPRDETQKKAIRYLVGDGEFESLKLNSQRILIMPTGYGKTYCAIAAIQRFHVRSIIIVRTKNLKDQWIEKFKEYTNMGGPNIVEIESSEQLFKYLKKPPSANSKVFITTRQLLISYMNRYGNESLNEVMTILGIGLKIFDEVHQEYAATFLIDYFTNVKYTFYLTATFKLSNYMDDKVFQVAYHMVNKLRISADESSRHITYIAVIFNSNPNAMEEHKVAGKKRGFDRYEYIDYELSKGILEQETRKMLNFFLKEKRMDGKTLILSSKKSTCDYFNNVIQSEMNGSIRSCSFYTGNKVDNYKEYDAISATPAMLGTGEDIPGLRFLFNTEPGSSLPNTDQFSGRLRPYEGGSKPTFYVEFIDVGFPKLYDWYQKRRKLLKKKVKECFELRP